MTIRDCERAANGRGLAVRECDCEDRKATIRERIARDGQERERTRRIAEAREAVIQAARGSVHCSEERPWEEETLTAAVRALEKLEEETHDA